ncbi:hypothetical protein ES703_02127 [subsurface metagenome]
MRINIISTLQKYDGLKDCFNCNTVEAYHLREALEKRGCEVRFVNDRQLLRALPPKTNHTIVISATAIQFIRTNSAYLKRIRLTTTGKLTIYLAAAWLDYDKIFDYIFTVVKPFRERSAKYVYVGWGADPTYCYPEQTEKAVFVDSFMYKFYKGKFNPIYDIIKRTLLKSKLKVYIPQREYHGHKKISWPILQSIMRKCHFYVCTQLGESGLTRIEAAYCGALLVVHKAFYRPLTMATLEHAIWTTEKELRKILKSQTNPMEISKKAHVHTWDKVANRILSKL